MSIRKAKFELSLISIRILFSAHHPTRLIKKIDTVRTHIRTHEPFGYIVLSPGMEFPSPSPDRFSSSPFRLFQNVKERCRINFRRCKFTGYYKHEKEISEKPEKPYFKGK